MGWSGILSVHSDTLYAMRDWPVRVYRFDISDPLKPTKLTNLNVNGMWYASSVEEFGEYIYVNGGGKSKIFKKNNNNGLSDPVAVRVNFVGQVTRMAIDNQKAIGYVAVSDAANSGIQIYDLAVTPENPSLIETVPYGADPTYIGLVSEGLLILQSRGFSIMKERASSAFCGLVTMYDPEGTIAGEFNYAVDTNLLPVSMDSTIAQTDSIDVSGDLFMRWPENIKSLGGALYRPVSKARLVKYQRNPLPVSTGTELTFSCCGDRSAEGCEAFVIVYHCASCSVDQNGGFGGLLAQGWDAGSCSPRFDVEDQHPTVTYHKYLKAGEVASFVLTKEVHHFVLATAPKMSDSEWCYKPHGPSPPQFAPCSTKCAL
eukprot:TRINITY_DN3041_c0_g2_i3.p1 TRINITY_DN3041_c0_g2~~TRINITY_DN3041_c0_g2_i3.p1  ORF type:complete len:372 (+),score=71.08 TRINITY_DN3041_c0_g2_i3:527-1642(+)